MEHWETICDLRHSRNFDEAEEWAEFLCLSVLANRPVIRNTTQSQAVGTVVSEALMNLAAPAGLPTGASPRKVAVRDREASADDRPIEGAGYRAQHPDAPGEQDGKGDPRRELLMSGSQLSLEAGDAYGDDLATSEELQKLIKDLEERLSKNHTMFKSKMDDKETELVRECKLHYKMDKAQVKADLAGVQSWLKSRPEGEVEEEELEEEQTKIRIWLHYKVQKLADDNDERLLNTEKLFHKYKAEESEKMDKVNKRLSVKIQILMERLQKAKEREKRDGFRPESKLAEAHSLNKEEEAQQTQADQPAYNGNEHEHTRAHQRRQAVTFIVDENHESKEQYDQHMAEARRRREMAQENQHQHPTSHDKPPPKPWHRNKHGPPGHEHGHSEREKEAVHRRETAQENQHQHPRGPSNTHGIPEKEETWEEAEEAANEPLGRDAYKAKVRKQRAQSEGSRLARLNMQANQNRQEHAGSPPVPTHQPGGSRYKPGGRARAISGVNDALDAERAKEKRMHKLNLRPDGKYADDPAFILSLGVGRNPSTIPKVNRFRLWKKTIVQLNTRPHVCLVDKAMRIQKQWETWKVRKRTNYFLKPLYDIQRQEREAAKKIQRAFRNKYGINSLAQVMQREIRRIMLRANFSFACFAFLLIVKVRKVIARREIKIRAILMKVKERRDELVIFRHEQKIMANLTFKVKPPKVDHSHVNKGLARRLQRKAQVDTEQKIQYGALNPIVTGLKSSKKVLSRFFGRVLQIDAPEEDKAVQDALEDYRERVVAHKHNLDMASGLDHKFDYAVGTNDIKQLHLRSRAVKNFVALKRKQKNKFLQGIEVEAGSSSDDDI